MKKSDINGLAHDLKLYGRIVDEYSVLSDQELENAIQLRFIPGLLRKFNLPLEDDDSDDIEFEASVKKASAWQKEREARAAARASPATDSPAKKGSSREKGTIVINLVDSSDKKGGRKTRKRRLSRKMYL